jgi:hypothetical protein
MVSQTVMKRHEFDRTRRFSPVFTKARHLSLLWASLIHSSPCVTCFISISFFVSLTDCHWLAVRILLIITYIHGAGISHSDYFPYDVLRFDSRKGRVIFCLVSPKTLWPVVEFGQPPGALPRGIKLPGREAASSTMGKNEWSSTAAPPVCLHDVY